jgi:trans-aconitate 2-methyltransferase
MTTQWDPQQYERFKTYRDRPALDLMVQIPSDLQPREIWDIGCGTGEHAALLALRHPGAHTHGLDSSGQMLAVARARPGRVQWVQADIAAFDPPIAPDLIFTNAALQWLPDHAAMFPRLVGALAPGGVFACQMPMTFEESWHVHLRAVAAEGPWAERIGGVRNVQPLATPAQYHGWLSPLAEVDIWSTTYLHVLEGDDPVVEWMNGTGLRPYLQGLESDAEREAFLAAYRAKVDADFPKEADGSTLFPFPRLFIVARRY